MTIGTAEHIDIKPSITMRVTKVMFDPSSENEPSSDTAITPVLLTNLQTKTTQTIGTLCPQHQTEVTTACYMSKGHLYSVHTTGTR